MASTYTLIQKIIVTSDQANISFATIPATYTDLVLKVSGQTAAGGTRDDMQIIFNNDTSANYRARRVFNSDGNTFVSDQQSTGAPSSINLGALTGTGATANTFGVMEFYIGNYAQAIYKPFTCFWSAPNNSMSAYMFGKSYMVYQSNTAISAIKLESKAGNNIKQYSTAYLYGISNA
jgi:hypothetical protein